MDKNMRVDSKILNEISRYSQINRYINEQDAPPPPPPPPGDPAAGEAPPPPPPPPGDPTLPPAPGTDPTAAAGPSPQPVDTENDPDVEKVGGEEKGKKDIEVTDLVKSQEKIEKKQEEYFDNLFKHLDDLESKLANMDQIVSKLNDLEAKVEKYRPKTPEEKLELRSLDSGPYNQKLSQFFEDKQEDLEKTGKNEYVLTQDEVEEYSPVEIKKSFRDFEEDGEPSSFKEVKY
jgi:hypothetical protein